MTETSSSPIAFAAEISKVLQLMIHSLYTNRDIFLRELISNASDACDKLRYAAITDSAVAGLAQDFSIRLRTDESARIISIEDNGIGMSRDDLIHNLGTIAKSGTQEFSQHISGDAARDVSLIGQFGVGFYASFMVADQVTVVSRKAGSDEAWQWQSDGAGSFTVTEANRTQHGTLITLRLKEDAAEYLDAFKLRFIARTYSDHIAVPIFINDEADAINEASALWAKPKQDITPEQYRAFYQHVAHSPEEPWLTLHTRAEGTLDYTSLLFVPGIKPFDLFHPERRRRVKLYVKRVFIAEEGVDLIPSYLRFLRGVVDSQDLPLNISRETLQKNATLDKIRDAVTSRVLSELKKRAAADADDYKKFWAMFGAVLKEGLCEAYAPREKIFEACRFSSTHDNEATTSLDDYIARMQPEQEAIYYLNGDNLTAMRNSPQLEGFVARGIEVLLLNDHVDDFWVNTAHEYKGKPFRSVMKAGADLDAIERKTTQESGTAEEPELAIATLIAAMKSLYGDTVKDVRITRKLAESPVCLAVAEGDMDMRMERFLMEHQQLPTRQAKILEINPNHPVITALATRLGQEDGHDAMWLLLDQAHIAEGEPVHDMAAYLRRVNGLLRKTISDKHAA